MLRMESAPHAFAARRPAASTLPGSFNLPPLPNQDTTPRVSNNEGLSPLSSNINNGGTPQTTQAATLPSSGYSYQTGNWPTPGSSNSSSYVYSNTSQDQSTPLSQPSAYSNPSASSNQGRSMYSPSIGYNARGSSQSPATGNENISGPPPASYGLPPYSSAASQSAIPSHSHQQQPILSSQAPVSQAPQQSTTPVTDSYSRPPPQSYYTQTSTPQHQSFPAFASHPPPHHQQPPQHAPTSSAMASRGLVSSIPGPHSPAALQPPPSTYGPPRGYPGYPPVPHTLGGGVLSNIASPNNPMTLVNSGLGVHHPGMYQMYGHQAPPPNDRPFKCDQCPQSFNRNHDLKRHKRIHLAVKPFPCNHCDKSFSRKDALKRHKLVKGCGSKDDAANANASTTAGGDNANTSSNATDGSHDDSSRTTIDRDPNTIQP